jgi:hypothetical protein
MGRSARGRLGTAGPPQPSEVENWLRVRPRSSVRAETERRRLSGPREADVTGPALRHRDDLQGLRAVAVLLVAFSHAGVGFLKGGFVGVDVFFVLSGFLITGLLLKEANSEGTVSIGEFDSAPLPASVPGRGCVAYGQTGRACSRGR